MKSRLGGFIFRTAVWVVSPTVLALVPAPWSSVVLCGGLLASAAWQWFRGGTLWLGLNRWQLATQLCWTAAGGMAVIFLGNLFWDAWAIAVLMAILLGGDVVSSPRRAKVLCRLTFPVILESLYFTLVETHGSSAYLVAFAGLVAAVSSLARPEHSGGVILTSLDYWFGRVELLSWGMQKLLAVGWRRK